MANLRQRNPRHRHHDHLRPTDHLLCIDNNGWRWRRWTWPLSIKTFTTLLSWERVNYPKWPQLIITLRLCLPQQACLCTPPPTTTSPKTSAATLTFQDQLQNCQGAPLAFIAIHHRLEPGSHTGWRCACRWPRWPPWRAPWTCTPTTTTTTTGRRPGTPGRGGLPRLAGTLISISFFDVWNS